MRGKLVKPEARILYWVGIVNLINAGWQMYLYLQHHFWLSLVASLIALIAGIFSLIIHWFINHPRIPKWAEDSFQD